MWTESPAEAVPRLEGAQHKAGIACWLVRAPLPQAPCGHVHTSCKLKHISPCIYFSLTVKEERPVFVFMDRYLYLFSFLALQLQERRKRVFI